MRENVNNTTVKKPLSADLLIEFKFVVLRALQRTVTKFASQTIERIIKMKPTLVADEMFPEGANFMDLDEPGAGSGLLMDLAANEKDVHADFYNNLRPERPCGFLDPNFEMYEGAEVIGNRVHTLFQSYLECTSNDIISPPISYSPLSPH
ncbi:COP9 signalosome complex subunit 9 [Pseudolycoriella hygida]|uniref:COP9 signalosome complex subunit 9 n=1 Tax=Pseudolycoriella hygida TaxID=35572 RepID=A0A9Q0N856_9DIPT|nr:COP9 signalosome complex subunit 9 [Pseudolycoriella hygida]